MLELISPVGRTSFQNSLKEGWLLVFHNNCFHLIVCSDAEVEAIAAEMGMDVLEQRVQPPGEGSDEIPESSTDIGKSGEGAESKGPGGGGGNKGGKKSKKKKKGGLE